MPEIDFLKQRQKLILDRMERLCEKAEHILGEGKAVGVHQAILDLISLANMNATMMSRMEKRITDIEGQFRAHVWGQITIPRLKGKYLTRVGLEYGVKRRFWGLEFDSAFRTRLIATMRMRG